ncbi:MAG: glycosyltransferase family 39 protein [Planctomycetota bacterium]
MSGLISALFFLIASILVALALRARGIVQHVVTTMVSFAFFVVTSGYLLSSLKQIDEPTLWGLCSLICLAGSCFVAAWKKVDIFGAIERTKCAIGLCIAFVVLQHRKGGFMTRLCGAFIIAFVLTQIAQLLVICLLPPANHDGHSYILPRMAQYIQQGSLDYFPSNSSSQTVHCKNATVLHIFSYLSTGRNENLVQLVAYCCSILATFSVFGIASVLWRNATVSLLAALTFSMLTSNIMIGVTPQLDMPITGFVAACVFFLVEFSRTNRKTWLVMSVLCATFAFGIKSSALLLIPSLGVIYIAALVPRLKTARRERWLKLGYAGFASLLVGAFLFVLPAGYGENMVQHGHPMGPEDWRQIHVLQDVSIHERLSIGTTNAARYAIHFTGVDGMGGDGDEIQNLMRRPLAGLFTAVGLDLNSTSNVRRPFELETFYTPHEDMSFWGPATYLLIIPGIIIALLRHRKKPFVVAFVAAGALYFLAQSYSSLYDPWRGRSFVNLGIFLVPLSGSLFVSLNGKTLAKPRWPGKLILSAVATVVLFAAINAAYSRSSSPCNLLFSEAGRIDLLCRDGVEFANRIRRYEENVPPGSTVLIGHGVRQAYNYPLYGEGLNRRIIFPGQEQSVAGIDFLLITDVSESPRQGDIPLDVLDAPGRDGNWYLRPMQSERTAAFQSSLTY